MKGFGLTNSEFLACRFGGLVSTRPQACLCTGWPVNGGCSGLNWDVRCNNQSSHLIKVDCGALNNGHFKLLVICALTNSKEPRRTRFNRFQIPQCSFIYASCIFMGSRAVFAYASFECVIDASPFCSIGGSQAYLLAGCVLKGHFCPCSALRFSRYVPPGTA